MYLSWFVDVPSGAVIILVGTAVFIAIYAAVGLGRRRQLASLALH
jgi:ABC-type Mn2+/Zn2+ transport system permease subunit